MDQHSLFFFLLCAWRKGTVWYTYDSVIPSCNTTKTY